MFTARWGPSRGPTPPCWAPPSGQPGVGHSTVAEFTVRRGERVPFTLAWFPSHENVPHPVNATWALSRTTSWWHDWSKKWTYDGDWPEIVQRSVITLKALTYAPTGGIVPAPTSSLPEWIGGVRHWDSRFGWLRDPTFTPPGVRPAGSGGGGREWRACLRR